MAQQVFLSYSRDDGGYADRLIEYLTRSGLQVWADRSLAPGDRWGREIRNQIDNSVAVIILMTPSFEDSQWSDIEISYAEKQRKPIFPLLLGGEPFFRLGQLQYEDVRDRSDPSDEFVQTLLELTGTERVDDSVADASDPVGDASDPVAEASSPTSAHRDHAVLMLHGIRTAGEWTSRIAQELRDGDPYLNPIPIGYGYFDAVRFLLPIKAIRQKPIDVVWRRIATVRNDENVKHISIIAHSYGTYIVGRILDTEDIHIHRLILCGSILPQRSNWVSVKSKIDTSGDPQSPQTRIVNDCGWKDIWPVLAKFATWGYGPSGRFGFQDPLVYDRYFDSAHSGFFKKGFPTQFWLPFLSSGRIEAAPQERPSEPWWVSMLTIVKLPVLVAVITLALLLFAFPIDDPSVPPDGTSTTAAASIEDTTSTATPEDTSTTAAASIEDTTSTATPEDTSTTAAPPYPPELARQRAESMVAEILADDDVESLVGQLLIASFPGPDPYVDELQLHYADSLFRRGRVGGLFLSSGNCNINNGEALAERELSCADFFGYESNPDTPEDVSTFTRALQQTQFGVSDELDAPFIPLFIAVDQEGDGPPLTNLVNGFHAFPSQMALGATWDPGSAYEVGQAVGIDLASVGINLLLGPVVDVMHEPKPSQPTDIGLRAFGSSAHLVSELAASYIGGVRSGSAAVDDEDIARVLPIVKHFPGHGGSNENPDSRLAEVFLESVGELEEVDLLPFGTLTAEPGDRRPGGIMSSHLLYPKILPDCGVGAILTFSPSCTSAFFSHMSDAYETFADWRESALVITDALGVQGLRDVRSASFDDDEALCDLAADALKAGHDMLLLGRWSTTDAEGSQRWSRELASVEHTVECLARRVRDNETWEGPTGTTHSFQARIEEAAVRVLMAKYNLYPELAEWDGEGIDDHAARRFELVTPSAMVAEDLVGSLQDDVDSVARRAVTEIDVGRAGAWRAIESRSSKSLVLIECWDDESNLCRDTGDGLVQGQLELIMREELDHVDFASIATVDLLTAWCLSDRGHNSQFLRAGGAPESCAPGDDPASDAPLSSEALFGADVVVFGVSASDPDSDVLLAVEDIVGSFEVDPVAIMIGTNRPYYTKRSGLSDLDIYVATFSKLDASLQAALKVVLLGFAAEGNLPVHYPEIGFDRDDFERHEAGWLEAQSGS